MVDMERFSWLSMEEDVEDVDDAEGDKGPDDCGLKDVG